MVIGSSHIGIVLSGGASSCETVEGNYSDGVGRVKRSYSEITGFCCRGKGDLSEWIRNS